MDAKEAREIVKGVEDEEGLPRLDNLVREVRYQYAKGFLSAVEKFGPVVEALEYLYTHCEASGRALEKTEEALESYRRDVLGEK